MRNGGDDPHIVYRTYIDELIRFYRFAVPEGSRVLELGCGSGALLASLKPSFGLGIDTRSDTIEAARLQYANRPDLSFITADVENFDWTSFESFDYIILSDLIPLLQDVQKTLDNLRSACKSSTRIVMNFHNNLWHPLLRIANKMGLRRQFGSENWLSTADVRNLLYLSGFQVITEDTRFLFPFRTLLIEPFFNRFLAKLPIFRHFCLTCTMTARPAPSIGDANQGCLPTVSILIPTRNEKGNIADAFRRIPRMGRWTELVFVDGHSTDGTVDTIQEAIEVYAGDWERCLLLHQTGKGKGQAVRQGFAECQGDILMILDSDLTMPPEDLPKYFDAIVSNKGEFINGSRLVYPMESKAMRFLNMLANKLFAVLFTWLLGQPVKDTLCGTKVLWRKDYEKIAANRIYFGDFDPFGDFDLLFGASKLNLKIVDMPVRYRDRTYGEIKISRWTHGMLLLRMCLTAMRKLKLS
ncbi:glycosyltransferase [bacterium]|nr:glycosyltransferase [candidate division CSSED10-310 bacterium]